MILKRQTNWLSFAITIMVLMLSSRAQATSDFQIWIPVNINAKLSAQLRGFLEFQPRIGNNAANLTTAIVRPALGWALNEKATLWVGYGMQADSVTPDADTYLVENRAWQGFTWKDTANEKQLIWEVRNRLEERFLARNADPSIRWRTRFRVEQLLSGWPSWSVIASEEIFVNLNDNANNAQLHAGAQQNRLYVGVGYRFAPEVQVETGYLYQHVWRNSPSVDQNNNIWMTNLNLNF
jgi:Protein of unknown function (DUF2490)